MRRLHRGLLILGVVVLAALLVVAGVLAPDVADPRDGVAPETPPAEAPIVEARRLPVAGDPKAFIVIAADGSAYLERDGKKVRLLDAAKEPVVDVEAISEKVELKRTSPAVEVKTKLIVLEEGVVAVPVDGTITLICPEYAVVVMPDGNVAAYYASGRVEQRTRTTPDRSKR